MSKFLTTTLLAAALGLVAVLPSASPAAAAGKVYGCYKVIGVSSLNIRARAHSEFGPDRHSLPGRNPLEVEALVLAARLLVPGPEGQCRRPRRQAVSHEGDVPGVRLFTGSMVYYPVRWKRTGYC